jgi:tripartite-type tricarboxylate transporter receptor subunit TctC
MRPDIYILRLAAGGATDSLSRIFYKSLGEVTGQQMVVANRADAGGDGSVKALGVTTKTRSPILHDVSAINKILPVFELTSWAALCGPAKLPPSLVTTQRIRQEGPDGPRHRQEVHRHWRCCMADLL